MPEVAVDGISKEGRGVARWPDGRVAFVAGALPGELVMAELVQERRSYVIARLGEVVTAHPGRVSPPCPHLAEGCGGCDLQHVSSGLAARLKERIVTEALERIGGLGDPPVVMGPTVAARRYRTTVRCAVSDGRPGYRRRSSHEVVPVEECLVVHPLIEQILAQSTFPGAREIQVRVGREGALVSVWGSPRGAEVPDGVVVASIDDPAWVTIDAAGRSWRVSGGSFFQASPEGAGLIVDAVVSALGEQQLRASSTLIDLYSGVGLVAGSVGEWDRIVAVESSRSAVGDALVNLGPIVEVVESRVEKWRPCPAEVVVADPSRRGLGVDAAEIVASTGAELVVLVSCDAAAGARDVALLGRSGYRLASVRVLDLFPQTSHVEMVSALVRA